MRRCEYECVCWAMVEYGDAECPGPCDAYAPMVDVDALRAMADDMERIADENRMTGMMSIVRARSWADGIREALGVDS